MPKHYYFWVRVLTFMLPELPIMNIHFGFLYFFFLWDSVGSTTFGTCNFHECNGEKQAGRKEVQDLLPMIQLLQMN